MKTLSLCLILLLSASAHATVYKYVDKDGNVTFTNVPIRGAQAIRLNPLSSYPSQHKKNNVPGNSSGGNGDAKPAGSYPSVDPGTQKQRDNGRRKILEQELANEQKTLSEAEKALADGKATRNGDETRNYQKYLNRVQKLQDEVTDRQKNVEALRRELGQN
ncbi:DUF4124 domain-containing protein [Chromobacterium haemolyticum]|uniref:DUF4124 domain-containing protein n=1 Tax=Chromobacterium haemolyticum TaxID=394935 RepID=UPI0009D9B104|nr:DUF4124 domain-containing protein [Chromobacterium haemolyticum]OQS39223.1 DUF4124 domain-containing protein [Chromobacterium haemolyticum]